jgi:hypothetical protein
MGLQAVSIAHSSKLEVELREYSILSFTETWLKESDLTDDVYLPGFQTPSCYCRNDRSLVGGGISVYVKKNSIYAKRRKDLEVSAIECVWIELSLSGKTFLYGTFYRPPNSNIPVWKEIEYSIDLAYNTQIPNIVIVGDFNANLLTNNAQSSHLLNIMYTYNMTQLIDD